MRTKRSYNKKNKLNKTKKHKSKSTSIQSVYNKLNSDKDNEKNLACFLGNNNKKAIINLSWQKLFKEFFGLSCSVSALIKNVKKYCDESFP